MTISERKRSVMRMERYELSSTQNASEVFTAMRSTLARQSSIVWRHQMSRAPTRQFSASFDDFYDVIIVGGGVVGCSMAKILNETMPRLRVALLEQREAPHHNNQESNPPPHPRSYALSPKSLSLLGDDTVANLKLGRYETMQVWEQKSSGMLVFSKADVSTDYLGACVEDGPLVYELWKQIEDRTSCYVGSRIDSMEIGSNSVSLETSLGKKLSSSLVVAADGANSELRKSLGLAWQGVDYGRTAVTATVELNGHMQKRAFQRFLPEGPLALLPTFSDRHATVVWSTTPEHAKLLSDKPTLAQQVNDVLQRGPQRMPPIFRQSGSFPFVSSVLDGVEKMVDTFQYGMAMRHWNDDPDKFLAPPLLGEVLSPVFSFPLSCRFVTSYVSQGRVVLIGDAAHTIHPMAGQGLNLGLEDVAVLASAIDRAYQSGMDVSTFVEQDYQADRRVAISLKLAGVHMLHELFSMQQAPMMHGKSAGMHFINQFGPLRQQLAKVATGM